MLKTLTKQTWTCQRCLLRQQRLRLRRGHATATPTSVAQGYLDHPFASRNSQAKRHDDESLREIFDSRIFSREFNQQSARLDGRNAGLVQNHYLTSPEGFEEFAHVTLQKCRTIVAKALAASTLEEYRTMAREMDRLSDLLCRVIDVSDFMRATHPDPRFVDAATQAYSLAFEYMNVLNTTTGLNAQLKKASTMPEVVSHWSEEEKVVAEILMKEFAKSAIELPPIQRQKFVELSNDISKIGTDFVNEMEPLTPFVAVETKKLNGMDPSLIQQLTRRGKTIIPVFTRASTLALSSVHDAPTRKQVYMAFRTASKKQIHRLEYLLQKRAELAKLSGYPSFAHMTLTDKMARTPEAATNFLESLNMNNQTQAKTEVAHLLSVKRASLVSSTSLSDSATSLKPWDQAYYLARAGVPPKTMTRTSRSRHLDLLPSFFSVGTVMQGLSRLFTHLYGIRLVPKAASPGETWNDDVRRLDVYSEDEGHIAVIYCDLFARTGKSPNPAHFTLKCSREISTAEIAEAASLGQHPNDGMATCTSPSRTQPNTQTLHQLPTIALICDFPEPAASTPSLLDIQHITTLFHEMGHAIHSILGRTSLQAISGTRCASDFSELPSILMEYFAFNPSVLRLFARHYDNDTPIPEELITTITHEKLQRSRLSGGLDDETQILMSLLDQKLHISAAENGIDSTAMYQQIWRTHGSLREPEGTAWQGFFGHLYGYGATYYSYLFDRAIAGQVWRSVFREGVDDGLHGSGALDRAAGERFREEVLKWGGGRDPWRCLEALFQDERLGEGGDRAMKEVGKWGLGLAGS